MVVNKLASLNIDKHWDISSTHSSTRSTTDNEWNKV